MGARRFGGVSQLHEGVSMIGEPMTIEELEAHIGDLNTQLSNERTSLRAIARYAERLQGVGPYGRHVVVRYSTTGDCLGASIDGIDSDKPAVLFFDVENLDGGYLVIDGTRYKRPKLGQRTWWLLLGDEVAFVSTRKPARTVTSGIVVYEWGGASE